MKKILIADINEKDLLIYVNTLTNNGHSVKSTVFGDQIIPLFEKQKPDIVILGSCVGDDNDADLIKEIRELNKDVRIIIMGHLDSLKKEALQSGANDFLVKPVTSKQLLAAVNK